MTLSRVVFLICSTFLLLLSVTSVSSTVDRRGVRWAIGLMAGAKADTDAVMARREVATPYFMVR